MTPPHCRRSPLAGFCTLLLPAVAACQLSVAQGAAAGDWPQWLGPTRNLQNDESGLLDRWPAEGPARLWLARDCGRGYGGPAVADGVLYLLGAHDGRACLQAIDTKTGELSWRTPLAEAFTNGWGDGPRSTPAVDGDRVYALTARGTLACVSTGGRVLWKVGMQSLGGQTPTWGYAESPLVLRDAVVCTPGGPQGAIAALDKRTGDSIWQSAGVTSDAHYSSCVPAELHGVRQIVQLLPDRLVGVAAGDGRLLWDYPWTSPTAAIPTPLVVGQRIYATSGYGSGCALVEIGRDFSVSEVYRNKVMKNKHGGVALVGGHLYGHSSPEGWVCQDVATGQRRWRERGALGMGSVGYADGLLYLLAKETGEVVLLDPTPDRWTERGRFTLAPQSQARKPRGRIWVHPIISAGKLYLRDQELLFCYDVRAQPTPRPGRSRQADGDRNAPPAPR